MDKQQKNGKCGRSSFAKNYISSPPTAMSTEHISIKLTVRTRIDVNVEPFISFYFFFAFSISESIIGIGKFIRVCLNSVSFCRFLVYPNQPPAASYMMNHMPMQQQQPHHPHTPQPHFYQVANSISTQISIAFVHLRVTHACVCHSESDRSCCAPNATDVLCGCIVTVCNPCPDATAAAFHGRAAASLFEHHCTTVSDWILPTASISSTDLSQRDCSAGPRCPKWLQSANVGWATSKRRPSHRAQWHRFF